MKPTIYFVIDTNFLLVGAFWPVERDLASAAGVAAANLDGGTKSGRGSESSKAGRKKYASFGLAFKSSSDLSLEALILKTTDFESSHNVLPAFAFRI